MKNLEKLIEQKDIEIKKLKTKIIEQEKLLHLKIPIEKKFSNTLTIIAIITFILIVSFSMLYYISINNGPLLEFKKSHKLAGEANKKIINEYNLIQDSTKISIKEMIPKEELSQLFKNEDNSYKNIEKIFLNSKIITNPSFYEKEIEKLTYLSKKKIDIAVTINKYKKEQIKKK